MYLSLSLSLYLYLSFSFCWSCHVFSSLWSQVSRIALWSRCFNVFVIVFVFVFVPAFLVVTSCPLITLIKCLKGHKALGSLSEGACMSKSKRSLSVVIGVGKELSQTLVWTAKNLWLWYMLLYKIEHLFINNTVLLDLEMCTYKAISMLVPIIQWEGSTTCNRFLGSLF